MSEINKSAAGRKGLLVSSIMMILAGILAWIFPDTALLAAAIYLGVMMLVSGGAYLIDFYLYRSGWLLATGLLDLLIGIVLVLNLGITVDSLPFLLALWILGIAIMQVAFGIDAKSAGESSWKWLILSGMTGIVFGLWILGAPVIGFITVSTLIGFYFVFYGCLGIAEYREIKKVR